MFNDGTHFAGYAIERLLGAGGMGEVYLVQHPRLPRHDALKVLAAPLAADPQYRTRFEREADLAASLSHPAIVQIHDRGETDGRLWIAMQYVDGVDLQQLLRAQGPQPASKVSAVVSAVAGALDTAHARGLVHRDVKPANILLSDGGHILLTDFGIARMAAEASDLTGTGLTVGTVTYASPEQLVGRPVDGRSDQYSLACTAFALLTGTGPFDDPNAGAVLAAHVTTAPPPITQRRPDLPSEVDAVVGRALAKDPADRYSSTGEFAAALATALVAPPAAPTIVRDGQANITTAVRPTPALTPRPIESDAEGVRANGHRTRPKNLTHWLMAGTVIIPAIIAAVVILVVIPARNSEQTAAFDPCALAPVPVKPYNNYVKTDGGCSVTGDVRTQRFAAPETSGYTVSAQRSAAPVRRSDWRDTTMSDAFSPTVSDATYSTAGWQRFSNTNESISTWSVPEGPDGRRSCDTKQICGKVGWWKDGMWIEVQFTNRWVSECLEVMDWVISQYPEVAKGS